MPFVGPSGRDVAVVGDPARAIRIIAGRRRVGGRGAQGRGDRPRQPAALYRNGAWLVIEGRIAAGCFQPARAGA